MHMSRIDTQKLLQMHRAARNAAEAMRYQQRVASYAARGDEIDGDARQPYKVKKIVRTGSR